MKRRVKSVNNFALLRHLVNMSERFFAVGLWLILHSPFFVHSRTQSLCSDRWRKARTPHSLLPIRLAASLSPKRTGQAMVEKGKASHTKFLVPRTKRELQEADVISDSQVFTETVFWRPLLPPRQKHVLPWGQIILFKVFSQLIPNASTQKISALPVYRNIGTTGIPDIQVNIGELRQHFGKISQK